MNVRYRVALTQYERNELGTLLSGGRTPARRLKRAQILLAADAGGLGHEDCPASGDEARDRRCGATAGGHHASHVGGWHRVSLDQSRSCGHVTRESHSECKIETRQEKI